MSTQNEHAQTERRGAEEEEFEVFVDDGRYKYFGNTFGEALRNGFRAMYGPLFGFDADTWRGILVGAIVALTPSAFLIGLFVVNEQIWALED